MRLLFVKRSLAWPRSSGHDVHTFYMMKACAELGHEVSFASVVVPEPYAVDGVNLQETIRLTAPLADDPEPLSGTWLQHRFRSFWGIEDHWVISLRQAVRRLRPHAVIVSGLDVLPFLPPLEGTVRIWYAADEWMLHHVSQLQASFASWREHARDAAIKGLYERAHRHVVDRAWVVSERDRWAMRRLAGVGEVDLLPNGVDGVTFAPGHETPVDRTAVFWGRLDFGPNVQALEWFCHRVWPLVRGKVADAAFTVIGFQPTDVVKRLVSQPGISLQANLRDLRSTARRHALAVLPFVSGAGIKNKLLEAAAMGMPIVGTPMAAKGLRGSPPIAVGETPDQLAEAIVTLWADRERRTRLGVEARAWVLEHHAWSETARHAMAALEAQVSASQ
jgi:glycosyltransferase involved in cell wall biosynthesis